MGGKTIGAWLGAALCLAALSGCAGPASLKGTTWYYSTGSEVKSIQFSGEELSLIHISPAQRGFFTPYVPGWDCHGQPIEHMVEKTLGPEKMARICLLYTSGPASRCRGW